MAGNYGQLKLKLDFLAELLNLPDNARILGAKQMEDDFDERTFTILISCPDFPELADGQPPIELSPILVNEDSQMLVTWTQGDEDTGEGAILSSAAQKSLKYRVANLSRFIAVDKGQSE